MSHNASKLLEAALQLDPNERADLAAQLFDSLDDSVEVNIGPLWDQEITKRLNELDTGKVKTVPWPEARARIIAPDTQP
ncbi:MAG: addiction module protein [Planctomycetes bacterium]|nr:addiction module protein [Planctomycetota bacterium]